MIINPEAKLGDRVKLYKSRMHEITDYLKGNEDEWGRFQSEFNQEIDAIFRDLIIFEKENLEQGREDRVYKLKNLFIRRFRDDFAKGELVRWSLKKPYGYAGDHKIIDDIYKNNPNTTGFDRLFDNYFLMSTISNAVRNRKTDFKKMILTAVKEKAGKKFKIMNLASGPCRDVYELLQEPLIKENPVEFTCIDSDNNAIGYARELLDANPQVKFIHQNAVRIALKKNITSLLDSDFDFIYSMGLFDYLDDRITIKLIANLRKLLKADGRLAIADVRDKFSNPSVYFMEWVGEWNLLYRDDDSFRALFAQAGFAEKDLKFGFEQQGVIQYVTATKN